MVRLDRVRDLLAVLSCMVLMTAACRDTEPPAPHARNLGTDGEILLPTGSEWRDAAVSKGQADWHPFREPGVSAEPGAGSDAVGEADTNKAEIEAEIRDVVGEYNGFVADGTTEDLVQFYAADQQEALEPWLEAASTVEEKLEALQSALNEKMPDAGERITSAFTKLGASSGRELTIDKLNVVSDTEVTATIGGGGGAMTYRFMFDEEEEVWFIEIPQIEALAALRPAIDVALATYDQMLQSLASGQMPPETILSQLEAAAQVAEATRAALEGKPEATSEAGADTEPGGKAEPDEAAPTTPETPAPGGEGGGG